MITFRIITQVLFKVIGSGILGLRLSLGHPFTGIAGSRKIIASWALILKDISRNLGFLSLRNLAWITQRRRRHLTLQGLSRLRSIQHNLAPNLLRHGQGLQIIRALDG
jgi:hypothetical protein